MGKPWRWSGVESGRIQSKVPNIMEIPRTKESVYSKCRAESQKESYEQCDTCYVRFKCWTAGRPQVRFDNDPLLYERIRQAVAAGGLSVEDAKIITKKLSKPLMKDRNV